MCAKKVSIGITGGIGAGKSTVARVFQLLGIPVYDADSRAKWLMNHQTDLRKQIITIFGSEAYQNDVLNRELLARVAFQRPDLLQQLNALVHPAVQQDYGRWNREQTSSYTLKEAALLFETGSWKLLDGVILVTAPEAVRTQRVLRRDAHRTATDVANIIDKQWPDAEKEALAKWIIRNDETELVIPQVLAIHSQILEIR